MDRATRSLLKRIGKVVGLTALVGVVCGLLILSTVKIFNLSLYSVSGDSMEPNLSSKDTVLLRGQKTFESGQLVFFSLPTTWKETDEFGRQPKLLVKRIVAVPGDTVVLNQQGIAVNGKLIYDFAKESYDCKANEPIEKTLPSDELLVLGDNALSSMDSRHLYCQGELEVFVPLEDVRAHGSPILVL